MNDRVAWIDISKGILIALVVFGHIIPLNHFGGSVVDNITTAFRMWLYACHIPGFFIISGMLKRRYGYVERHYKALDILKKQKKTILYYVVFSGLFFCRYVIQSFIGLVTENDLLMFIYNTGMLVGMGVLWFIPTFVLSELLFNKLINDGRKIRVAYAIILIAAFLSISIWGVHNIGESTNPFVKIYGLLCRSLIGCSFVIVGYYLEKIDLFSRRWLPLLLGIVSLTAFFNGNVDLNNLWLRCVPLYYIYATTGTLFIISASQIIARLGGMLSRLLAMWGGQVCLSCQLMPSCLSYKPQSWFVVDYLKPQK